MGRKGQLPLPEKNSEDPSCDNWHPPGCQNYRSETGCICGKKCRFRQVAAEEKPCKKPKKGGATGSLAIVKEFLQFRCVSQDPCEHLWIWQRDLDLRDGESRMSNTAFQEVLIMTVHTCCAKQQRGCAHLKNGLTHAL